MDAFIREENPYNLNTSQKSGNFPVYHYRQNPDGTYSTSNRETAYMTLSGTTTFTLTDKYEGFTVVSASTGTNGFNPNGGNLTGSSVSISTTSGALHVYHRRNTYQFTFDTNYPTDASVEFSRGRSENRTEIVLYDFPLSEYGRTLNGNISH